MSARILAILATVAALSWVLAACSFGPADRRAVCTAYDALGAQLSQGNGLFGNPVFTKAEDLSDLADRYEGNPNLSGDSAALHRIAKSDSTSGLELMNATGDIANLCGHPLGFGTTSYGGGTTYARPSTVTRYPTYTYVPPTTSSGPSAEDIAESSLEAQRGADRAAVEQLTGKWIPQLSSKNYGTVDGGISYDYEAIWLDYQSLKQRYPQALLLWSGDYRTFSLTDYWVTIVAAPSATAATANKWCDDRHFGANDCFAKLISHTAGPKGATAHR